YLERYPELAAEPGFEGELCAAELRCRPGALVGRTRLGRFELRGEVGAGGMGVVHRAYDPTLGRDVAIKVPRPGLVASPADAARFLREARSAARLRHPGLVAVHEAGESDGTVYLVSEFIEGTTLAALLRSGPPGPRR